MKLIKYLGCLLILALTIQSCREPYEINIVAEDQQLVVDGFITDQLDSHLVRLSYTSSVLDNITIPNPAFADRVELHDDLGTVMPLRAHRNGEYYTPVFQAEEERAYRIVVTLGDEVYQSTFESLPEVSTTPSLQVNVTTDDRNIVQGSALIRREGLVISAQIDKSILVDQKPAYYQWFLSDCRPEFPVRSAITRNCNVFNDISRGTALYLHQDNYLANLQNVSYSNELTWIARPNSLNVSRALVIEIDQLLLSAKAYDFWSRVQNAIESNGTIFDPTGARILGNIENTKTGEATLGFFGVYRESAIWEQLIIPGY